MSSKSKIIKYVALFLFIPATLVLGFYLIQKQNYLLAPMLFAIVSIVPFYFKYEQRKPQAREFIIIAVMTALAVASRLLFAFLPGIKPIVALVIICGAAFGKEDGFMCGSLSALLSNMFFGQGPWTLYQMLIWGIIGYNAGVLNKAKLIDNAPFRYFYATICGIMFSVIIDFLTVLGSGFTWTKYVALLIPAIPFMAYYAVGNIIFLYFLYEPMMKKLNRVKLKYGLVGIENNFVGVKKNQLV